MASQAQGRTLAPRPPVRKVTHQQKQTPVQRVDPHPKRGSAAGFEGHAAKGPERGIRQRRRTLHDLPRDSHEALSGKGMSIASSSVRECHGPASEHIASRGQEIGKILETSERLKPAERSEFCLRCHEKELKELVMPQHVGTVADLAPCPQGRLLHGLPPLLAMMSPREHRRSRLLGKPHVLARTSWPNASARKSDPLVRPAASTALQPRTKTKPSLRGTSQSLGAASPDVCYRCHQGSQPMNELTGPHKIGTATGSGSSGPAFRCERPATTPGACSRCSRGRNYA